MPRLLAIPVFLLERLCRSAARMGFMEARTERIITMKIRDSLRLRNARETDDLTEICAENLPLVLRQVSSDFSIRASSALG